MHDSARSGIVDNIPSVATMAPIVNDLVLAGGGSDQANAQWWALAVGADLGGNATVVLASTRTGFNACEEVWRRVPRCSVSRSWGLNSLTDRPSPTTPTLVDLEAGYHPRRRSGDSPELAGPAERPRAGGSADTDLAAQTGLA